MSRCSWPSPLTDHRPLDDAARRAALEHTLRQRPSGPLWTFACGSLLWNPGFEPVRRRRGVVPGYRRSFCVWSVRARGTPQRPGLALALEPAADSCVGLLYALEESRLDSDLATLWEREMFSGAYAPCWVDADIDEAGAPGPRVRALAFVANVGHPQYTGSLDPESRAAAIAGAHGRSGPCRDYLARLVLALRELDAADPELEALMARVDALSRGA